MILEPFLAVLRMVIFALAAVAAVVFVLDWLVRTRRINAFSPIARFARRVVDPILAPIERSVVRAGGTPASAPWWGLVAVVVGGIVLITALESVAGMLGMLLNASNGGPASLFVALFALCIQLLQFALLVRVFTSWLPISPYSPWVRWSYSLTEWILRPLRQVVPTLGAIDITPIIAYYLIRLVGGALVGMVARTVA